MIGLCCELGMVTVAEGIETEAELRHLSTLGCDLYQGYLVARPGPPWGDVGLSAARP